MLNYKTDVKCTVHKKETAEETQPGLSEHTANMFFYFVLKSFILKDVLADWGTTRTGF